LLQPKRELSPQFLLSRKVSQTIWHCQYQIVWVPRYRYRILNDHIAREVENCVRAFSEQLGSEITELNIQEDHVHLLVLVPPKVSISGYVVTIKGRTAIRLFNRFRKLKEKPYWGNRFWARGYCVDTVGLDPEMVQKYIRYQEQIEHDSEKPAY